ncbi:GTP-binding protein [Escherichia coli]|nr:GTP-binding protein [Escherichia coli]
MTDFGGKTSIFSHPVYLFLREFSLQDFRGGSEHISDLVLEHIRQSIHYEPVIGIMGKTGAGKSSLCNALFEHPLSPVSHAEGCTRKPLHFTLNAGGRSLTLVDLPGVVAH